MYPELRDSGIVVTNPSGIFSVPMAEHTMGLLVALARNFKPIPCVIKTIRTGGSRIYGTSRSVSPSSTASFF